MGKRSVALQANRIDRREPPDRVREIGRVGHAAEGSKEVFFASVTFDVHREGRRVRPTGQCLAQSVKERIVDPGTLRGKRMLQSSRLIGGQFERDGFRGCFEVRRIRPVCWQWGA